MSRVLTNWNPEDDKLWQRSGKKIAKRNLIWSVLALVVAFCLWLVWSVVVVKLPKIGFTFSTNQLFWLAALPGLSGATLRIFFSFMIPIFGGRLWTTITTIVLLIPAIGMGMAVQNVNTSYSIFVILALLCGIGGGNFASSMANIAYFYPKKEKGNALALNAGLGNLGVSVVQLLIPFVISLGIFGAIGGVAQVVDGKSVWLQNAGYFWVPFIVIFTLGAWFFMNDIADTKASLAIQLNVLKRKHCWIMSILYTGTFGSFIGFSAGFPLLTRTQFPHVNVLAIAWLGPFVGALTRALAGKLTDKYGGGKITLYSFVVMFICSLLVVYFLINKSDNFAFTGFLITFIILFAATGFGNAAVFQMIPVIFREERARHLKNVSEHEMHKTVERESATTIGFVSAIAAYGAFFIPKAYGTSLSLTGKPNMALVVFAIFYLVCTIITWWYYTRGRAEIKC